LNVNNQISIPNLDPRALAGNYTTYTTFYGIYTNIINSRNYTDTLIVKKIQSSYPQFVKTRCNPTALVDPIYFNDINNNADGLRYITETIMLIVAEHEYPTNISFAWGIEGKILMLFLATFLIKYDINRCMKTIESIAGLRDIFLFKNPLPSYEIDINQLFRNYKIRLQSISNNEQKKIFNSSVIKKDLITLQKDGIKLEKLLKQEENENIENIDKLKCIQNRIKNKIKSL
jgi:hypothetical protein